MAAAAGSGSWLTLISGVAAGEPSGGGEGLLFPFAGALSLRRRDKRGARMQGGRGVQEGVRVTGCVHVPMPRGPVCENVHARVCVHVDPGKLRVHVCVQTHWKNVTPTCAQVCVPVHPRVKLHIRVQKDRWK